jgi:ABC-type multidrug transport system ATPase subunit
LAVVVCGLAVFVCGLAVVVRDLAVVVCSLAVVVYGLAVVVCGLAVFVCGLAVVVYGLAVVVCGLAVVEPVKGIYILSMIEIQELTKKYGKTFANDRVSLHVKAGEFAVLLGPNGAGKSTLIKSICGLLRFQGRITINGFDNHMLEAKRILGYVPEIPALYPMLTLREHLEFIARAYRLNAWEKTADALLERFELGDKQKKLGKELSKGMQQKISLCCALLPEPKALILDEPLVGLDPHAIRELKALIPELKNKGVAVMVSTHLLESVADDWDTTHIMMGGRLVRSCERLALGGTNGESLEELYFTITEGLGAAPDTANGKEA